MTTVFNNNNSTGEQSSAEWVAQYDKRKAHIYSCEHPIMAICARLLLELDAAVPDDLKHVQALFMVSVNHATWHGVNAYIGDIVNELPDEVTDLPSITGFEKA